MLTLTNNAAAVISSLTANPDLPAGSGLRISADTEDRQNLSLMVAGGPNEEDQVVEDHGARVFLEPNASETLENMVLDAEINESGGVQFFLGAQPGGPSPENNSHRQ